LVPRVEWVLYFLPFPFPELLSRIPHDKKRQGCHTLLGFHFRQMGLKIEFVPTDYPALVPALLDGDFDIVISGLGITPERNLMANCRAEVQFTVPKLYFPVVYFLIFFSKFFVIFPPGDIHLSFKIFFRYRFSFPKKNGSDNLIIFFFYNLN